MFWKSARHLANTMGFRMALSLAIGSALLQILLCTSLYWFLSWQISQDTSHFMDDVTSLLQTELAAHDDIPAMLHQQILQELAAFHFNPYQVRIVEKGGQQSLLFQSPHFPVQTLPMFQDIPVYLPEEQPGDGKIIQGPRGNSFLILAAEAQVGHSRPRSAIIQLVIDVSSRVAFLADLKVALMALVLLGTCLFSLLGLLVVRKGLTPLQEFSTQIGKTDMNSLHQRMCTKYLSQELQPLAVSFDRLLARLEKDVDQLNRFAGDLAHELRTPVTNLRVETEVLLTQGRTIEEYGHVLENNLVELERLSYLIERTLLLAKMDHPQFTGQRETLWVRPVVEKLISFYTLLADEKQIQLTVEGEVQLLADPQLLEQALGNLLSNAIKYTPMNGLVQINLYNAQSSEYGTCSIISVRDNGFGIDPEHLPHICTRFYRGDLSRSQIIQGDGLGLAIVKSILDLHNGKLEVDSTPNKGTEFKLIFTP